MPSSLMVATAPKSTPRSEEHASSSVKATACSSRARASALESDAIADVCSSAPGEGAIVAGGVRTRRIGRRSSASSKARWQAKSAESLGDRDDRSARRLPPSAARLIEKPLYTLKRWAVRPIHKRWRPGYRPGTGRCKPRLVRTWPRKPRCAIWEARRTDPPSGGLSFFVPEQCFALRTSAECGRDARSLSSQS